MISTHAFLHTSRHVFTHQPCTVVLKPLAGFQTGVPLSPKSPLHPVVIQTHTEPIASVEHSCFPPLRVRLCSSCILAVTPRSRHSCHMLATNVCTRFHRNACSECLARLNLSCKCVWRLPIRVRTRLQRSQRTPRHITCVHMAAFTLHCLVTKRLALSPQPAHTCACRPCNSVVRCICMALGTSCSLRQCQ